MSALKNTKPKGDSLGFFFWDNNKMQHYRNACISYLTILILGLFGYSGHQLFATTVGINSNNLKAGLQKENKEQLGYRRINEPDQADLMNVAIFELDNGLRVYLAQNQEEPRFHAEVVVRVGGKNDPDNATGLAHYLEHLLIKGTKELWKINYQKEEVHLERITQLYEQHYLETNPENREAIYAQINAESQLSAQYAIPNEINRS